MIDLSGARILMTGGTGFVGKAMQEYIIRARANTMLYIVSRQKIHSLNSNIEFLRGTAMTCEIPEGITHVVHLEPSNNIDTRKFLTRLARAGSARFLYASSGAVYNQPILHIDESALLKPGTSWYAQLKAAGERTCALSDLDIVIARMFAFVGPYLPDKFAVSSFIRDGLSGGPIVVNGKGGVVRSYMYASDMAEWMWTLLALGKSGCVYNVGSEDALTITQLAQRVSDQFPNTPDIVYQNGDEVGLGGPVYVPSTQRARDEFGLSQRIALDEALRLTIEARRANGG